MLTIKHIVQIYFSINREVYGDLSHLSILPIEWLETRFKLFHDTTLRSILNQSNRNFDIWVMCGSWRKEITDGFKWNENVKVLYDNGRRELRLLNKDFVAITRIDSDDLMHVDAMQEVIAETRENIKPEYNKITFGFNKNLVWNKYNTHLAYHYRRSPPFFTHVLSKAVYKDHKKFTEVHNVPHGKSANGSEFIKELSTHKICVVKHGITNNSLRRRGLGITKMSNAEWKKLLKQKRVITKDKKEMYKYLKDFGVLENEI